MSVDHERIPFSFNCQWLLSGAFHAHLEQLKDSSPQRQVVSQTTVQLNLPDFKIGGNPFFASARGLAAIKSACDQRIPESLNGCDGNRIACFKRGRAGLT
ncbi:MAG: hypothetical protein HPY82_22440 [Gammaproteobacteria bacterium]|nr:hypothetical protein [Gammaproteobacteria bacterium]